MDWVLDVPIAGTPFLIGLSLVTVAVLAPLLVGLLHPVTARRGLVVLGVTAVGALFGLTLAWVLGDVWDVFGVSLTLSTRLHAAALFASVALVTAALLIPRFALPPRAGTPRPAVAVTSARRFALAGVAVLLSGLTAAAGVNADFGQYPTLRTALGLTAYAPLGVAAPTTPPGGGGAPGTAVGTVGTVGTVDIPATTSGFPARPALVYLPPAARRPHPPALPVVVMLSGQPGSPQDVFAAGQLAALLNSWSAAGSGPTPIVVVPDQLGARDRNPMCVDSPLGRSATYLTVDVPAWIRAHFRTLGDPAGWTIAGYSEGGTCSIQLGAAHPELFGNVLDISGEERPHEGSIDHTVAAAFGGSMSRYQAAAPAAILAAHAPYRSFDVIFAAGAQDGRYLAVEKWMARQAVAAGAVVDLMISPGTAHDWYTVRYAWKSALPLIAARAASVSR